MTQEELRRSREYRDFCYQEWQSADDALDRGKWRSRYLREDKRIKDHEQQQGQDHR